MQASKKRKSSAPHPILTSPEARQLSPEATIPIQSVMAPPKCRRISPALQVTSSRQSPSPLSPSDSSSGGELIILLKIIWSSNSGLENPQLACELAHLMVPLANHKMKKNQSTVDLTTSIS